MRSIYLLNYAPHAHKGILADSDRKAAAENLLAGVGGKVESFCFTRREFDACVTVQMPIQRHRP